MALCTNLQCIVTAETSELLAEVNPLAYFNEKRHYNQLYLFSQLPQISNDAGEAFTAPMCELVNKYTGVFTKPGKPAA